MKTKIFIVCLTVGISLSITNAWAVQFNLTPQLTISEEYTDNLFLDSDEENKVDDFITTTGLSLTGEALWRTAGLEINYSPSYHEYSDNDFLNYWRHEAFLRFYKGLSRNIRLELMDTFLKTEDPRDESRGIEDAEGANLLIPPVIERDRTRRDRQRRQTNVAQARLTHQLAANSQYYVGIRHTSFREIDPIPVGVVNDYDATMPLFGLEYWFNVKWGMLIEASVSDRDYVQRVDRKEYFGHLRMERSFERHLSAYIEYRQTALEFKKPSGRSDYVIYSPALGFKYRPGKNTNIDFAAGYYIQDFEEDNVEDEEGLNLYTSLANTWPFRTGHVTLIGLSGYRIDDRGVDDLGLNIFYEARVGIGKNFTNRLIGEIYASYREDLYPNETPDRTDKTIEASAGMRYQVLKWLNLRLRYEYIDVSSEIELAEYTENSVTLTLNLVPSSPLRF